MKRKPKRIVVDARMVGPVGHGISQYVTGLAKGLLGENRGDYELIYLVSEHLPRKEFPWNSVATYPMKAPYLHLSELWEIPRALRTLEASLYHSPSFSSLLWSPCPWIVTVHDLNHLHYGSTLKKFYYRWILKRFVEKAREVLSVSATSATEIKNWITSTPSISIVPNVIELQSSGAVENLLTHYELKEKQYLLALSNSKPHKNLPLLLEAFEKWKKFNPASFEWKLVISDRVKSDDPSVVSVRGLTSQEVSGLLRKSAALVFPSLYEGFGRPPLEAIASGIPTLVSDIPVHREALGGIPSIDQSIRWVSPHHADEWLKAFDAVRDGVLLPPRMEACAYVLEAYSAEKSARLMDQIYQRALA